jgi:hypothetical protein
LGHDEQPLAAMIARLPVDEKSKSKKEFCLRISRIDTNLEANPFVRFGAPGEAWLILLVEMY